MYIIFFTFLIIVIISYFSSQETIFNKRTPYERTINNGLLNYMCRLQNGISFQLMLCDGLNIRFMAVNLRIREGPGLHQKAQKTKGLKRRLHICRE